MRNSGPAPQTAVAARGAAFRRVASLLALTLTLTACAATRQSRPPRVTVAPPRLPLQPAGAPATAATPPEAARPASGLARWGSGPIATVRVRVTDQSGTRIVTLPVDDYVVGAVRAELPPKSLGPGAAAQLLRVQAIVSRTYALANLGRHAAEGFDLCDGTHCQLYRAGGKPAGSPDPAAQAVAATAGEVITYGGRPIQALFHSNCGGHTAAAETVWGGPGEPYLQPVEDAFCARAEETHWEFSAESGRLRDVLNGDPRTQVGRRLDRIDVAKRDTAGRAILVVISGERSPMIRAEELRTVVRQGFGPRSMKSTWFEVERRGPQFVFSGLGYGHGVGLCQTGATLRAQAGESSDSIIEHYFPGTRLRPLSALVLPAPATTVTGRSGR